MVWKIFIAVFAAIVVAVFVFLPEKLPSGVGIKAIPVKVSMRESAVGKGLVAVISNCSGKTLYNMKIVCKNFEFNQEKIYTEEEFTPEHTIEIGWMEGWKFCKGEVLKISVSGYLAGTWTIK